VFVHGKHDEDQYNIKEWKALGLTPKYRTWLKMLCTDTKGQTYFLSNMDDKEILFFSKCYKTFFLRQSYHNKISCSVCAWQA
jgi:hypothetical protein